MTLFQIVIISILSLLVLWELLRPLRGPVHHLFWLVRCATWLAAATAIAFPGLVTDVANSIGIQRGADFVSYLSALLVLTIGFVFYGRYMRLQSQITDLVRHIALLEAQRGGQGHDLQPRDA